MAAFIGCGKRGKWEKELDDQVAKKAEFACMDSIAATNAFNLAAQLHLEALVESRIYNRLATAEFERIKDESVFVLFKADACPSRKTQHLARQIGYSGSIVGSWIKVRCRFYRVFFETEPCIRQRPL